MLQNPKNTSNVCTTDPQSSDSNENQHSNELGRAHIEHYTVLRSGSVRRMANSGESSKVLVLQKCVEAATGPFGTGR